MSATVTGERRFPQPWKVEELEACFFVTDSGGQELAYIYYEDEPGRRSAAKQLTKDEARRIATNIAMLPESYCNLERTGRKEKAAISRPFKLGTSRRNKRSVIITKRRD